MLRYAFRALTHEENIIKFTRCPDLDTQARINLVAQALACQGIYGARTALANRYQISRTFLYQMIGVTVLRLGELFATQRLETVPAKLELDAFIILLRLEGQAGSGTCFSCPTFQWVKMGIIFGFPTACRATIKLLPDLLPF